MCCRFIGLFYLLGAEMSRKSFITDPIELVFIIFPNYVICKVIGQLKVLQLDFLEQWVSTGSLVNGFSGSLFRELVIWEINDLLKIDTFQSEFI